ncbi:Cro/CI family transcriptional regulator [Halomonas sp. WWR20]
MTHNLAKEFSHNILYENAHTGHHHGNVSEHLVSYFGAQAKAAEALQINQSAVSNWVRGKHGMSPVIAMRAEVLTAGKFKASDLYRRLDDNDAMPLRYVDMVSIFWGVDRASQERIIQPFLDHLGMVAVDRVKAETVEREDIFGAVLDKQAEGGRLATLIHQAIADDEIDEEEAAQLGRAVPPHRSGNGSAKRRSSKLSVSLVCKR